MRTCLLVGAGGFLGSVARYLISLIPMAGGTGFPLNTFIINIVGSFVIGALAGLAAKYAGLPAEWMAFLRAGICGGFTTFSTFALEVTNLLGTGRTSTAVLYMLLSLLLGVAAVILGERIFA